MHAAEMEKAGDPLKLSLPPIGEGGSPVDLTPYRNLSGERAVKPRTRC
jgi:hypothetical protein